MLTPRTYQAEAYQAAIDYCRRTDAPGIIKIGTGGGKSIIVALLAHHVKKAGKKVLCLAPNADLVEQNAGKYRATGEKCSIFCASLGKKNTGHDVVFASPLSVLKSLSRFNDEYALVISDESQGVSEDEDTAYQKIFAHLRARNPKLRIVGLTATDSRFKTKLVSDSTTFKAHIYQYEHLRLSMDGWVVPYEFGHNHATYDLGNVKQKSTGKFDQAAVDAATLGRERLTRKIVADVVEIMAAQDRKAAIFFASSIKHAEEIVSYLPEGTAKLVTGKTNKKQRANILDETRAGQWRYLVTVSALAVGTDLPIVDTIAVLRATESVGFYLQQLGRGCRLYDPQWQPEYGQMNWTDERYDGKKTCLILDFAENLERFALSDDLTITKLVEHKQKVEDDEYLEIECPECKAANKHTAIRCVGILSDFTRCEYRFIAKVCEACKTINSPSARYCRKCEHELIDPNDKLTRRAARASGKPFYAEVETMTVGQHVKNSNIMLRVTYMVSDGDAAFPVSDFIKPDDANFYARKKFRTFQEITGATGANVADIVEERERLNPPSRLILKRQAGSKYYEIVQRIK